MRSVFFEGNKQLLVDLEQSGNSALSNQISALAW